MKDTLWVILQKNESSTKYETERLLASCPDTIEPQLVLHPTVDIIVSREDRRSIRVKGKVLDLPKVAIPRTGSGTGFFGMSILRHLERLEVPVVNTASAIEATRDKLYSTQVFAEHHLPVPKTMLIKHPANTGLVEREIGFPCVVKIFAGSYGKGVYLVHNRREFQDFIDFAHGIKEDEAIIVQEYINSRPGQDVRVMVVGGRAIGAMKRSSQDGSFKANITRGGVGENYPLDDEISEIAVKTADALGLDVAGIDLLFDGNHYKVCEANSAPGFQGFEKCTGIDVARAIIDYALTKY